MDELKNENLSEQSAADETVIEQRPSTKYGRTAYQQQLQREQQEQENARMNQSNAYSQPEYHQAQYTYQTYTPYEEAKPNVKNIFANIAMILIAVSKIVSCIANIMASQAYTIANTMEEVVDALAVISSQPAYVVLATINDIAFWGMIFVLVMDITQLRSVGKKAKGAILFAIFLRPAYFIWRAHLLGEKKIVPIIYAIALYLIAITQYVVLFQGAMDMVMRTI